LLLGLPGESSLHRLSGHNRVFLPGQPTCRLSGVEPDRAGVGVEDSSHLFVQVVLHEMLLESLSVHETLSTRRALVRSIAGMEIRMIRQPALLREAFPAHVAGVGTFARVDAHVPNQSVVNGELALTNLTPIRLLVCVGAVVERQLVLLVEAGGTLVALELPLGMKVEVLHVLFFVEEAFPALPALVGFDTVNTDHVGSELATVAESGVTMLTVIFSLVEETTV